jgi:hypothetical protein
MNGNKIFEKAKWPHLAVYWRRNILQLIEAYIFQGE